MYGTTQDHKEYYLQHQNQIKQKSSEWYAQSTSFTAIEGMESAKSE
jgi:hypothetical protein